MPQLVTFSTLAGSPVHYDREAGAYGYGSRGRHVAGWRLTAATRRVAEEAFAELWARHPRGQAEIILTAGTYPGMGTGAHAAGIAIDLDGLWWPGGYRLLTSEYPQNRIEYLGVESILRRHFGVVLGWHTNAAHHDHLHCDRGEPVEFRTGSGSRVGYLRASLAVVHGVAVEQGHEWHPALRDRLTDAGLPDVTAGLSAWLEYLDVTADRALRPLSPPVEPPVPSNPLELLHGVYAAVNELRPTGLAKGVEASLNQFSGDEATQAWLEQWR